MLHCSREGDIYYINFPSANKDYCKRQVQSLECWNLQLLVTSGALFVYYWCLYFSLAFWTNQEQRPPLWNMPQAIFAHCDVFCRKLLPGWLVDRVELGLYGHFAGVENPRNLREARFSYALCSLLLCSQERNRPERLQNPHLLQADFLFIRIKILISVLIRLKIFPISVPCSEQSLHCSLFPVKNC